MSFRPIEGEQPCVHCQDRWEVHQRGHMLCHGYFNVEPFVLAKSFGKLTKGARRILSGLGVYALDLPLYLIH